MSALKKATFAATGMVATTLLSGCAIFGVTAGEAAAPMETGPPADGGSYATIHELRDAVVEAGFACPDWRSHNNGDHNMVGASCSDNLVMAIYMDDAQQQEQLDVWEGFSEFLEMTVLVGDNWTVNTDDAEALRREMGGTIFTTGDGL